MPTAFFHDLATRDARHRLPCLHRLARKEDLVTKDSGFIIYPAKFSLQLLSDYERNIPASLDDSLNAEGRNEAFVKRARQNPGKFMQVDPVSAQQRDWSATGHIGCHWGFWNDGTWDFLVDPSHGDDERDSLDDESYDTNIDGIDVMKARIDQFTKSVAGREETHF
ncbi:hypothetical protein IW261DRAFT_1475966 [Armillaria novae-zelandiae]|uniref:Uncharacterized protein n=1 Tax=Armillaria novae-zelandiae TaxID=153914 RepID=A0AA39P9H9_9AGAR|nr:hypothetical protein IW261DRAFT_1475966 [Armillaria novae-zelandiae]